MTLILELMKFLIDDEVDRIYASLNHNKNSIDTILSDTIELGSVVEDPFRRKDSARYKVVDGSAYDRIDAPVLSSLLFNRAAANLATNKTVETLDVTRSRRRS